MAVQDVGTAELTTRGLLAAHAAKSRARGY